MTLRAQSPRRIDEPHPCFLRMRLVKGGPYVGARIFLRLGMLAAEVNGVTAEIYKAWFSGEFISSAEWEKLDRERPANPELAIDWTATKPAF